MLTRLRFWISLWGGKFFLALFRRTGNEQDDRPGMASLRLFGDFLRYVKKPPMTIVITGTNGKTSISSMVADVLRQQGMTVAYNDWGANHHAGVARCLLDTVDLFNRSTKEVAVIELDELISPLDVPQLRPQYFLVNNLARDSMIRNAHPAYIAEHVRRAADSVPDTTVILNADDPLSCFMGDHNRRLYFGVCDRHTHPAPTLIDDFAVCPVCGGTPRYAYRNYRQIGDFSCPVCGLHSPHRDYTLEAVDTEASTLTLREPDGSRTSYPMMSSSVHNLYNTTALLTLLRDMGIAPTALARALEGIRLPASRESRETVGGIELITHGCKGQNATASSTVFEHVAHDPAPKDVVLLLDEVFANPKKSETVAWLWDTDYEYFRDPSVRKIIVGGERWLDHRLRLCMAGIPPEKFVCVRDMDETPQYVDTDGIEKIYILHDVTLITRSRRVRDAIRTRLESEGRQNV